MDSAIPKILTLEEVAEHLKVSVKTTRRRIAAGQLKSFKEGGRVMVPESELANYLQTKIQNAC